MKLSVLLPVLVECTRGAYARDVFAHFMVRISTFLSHSEPVYHEFPFV